MAKNEEALKILLIRVKKESEKAGLKLDIHKYRVIWSTDGNWSHHFMANRWGNNGNSLSIWAPKSLQKP